MHSLIATQDFWYASKDLKAGDPFEAQSDADARILKATGKARDAADGAATDNDGQSKTGKRYRRRDMRAED